MSTKDDICEEDFRIGAEGAFYNQNMRFCRSIYSLAVGAINEQLYVLDAFCASGIRGIRYSKENENVKSITFLDWSKNCISLAKKNAKKNKVAKAKFVEGDVNRWLMEPEATGGINFVEIDPFGTPAPHLYPVFSAMQKHKEFYLSATATDTAVLCGHETKACLKNYHSKNLNNEFTHENGLRILLKRVAEAAAEFNFGTTPLFCISDRHYLKVLVKCDNSAIGADESVAQFGYVSYCNSCAWMASGKRAEYRCARCGKATEIGGQVWLGETSDKAFVKKMAALNAKRDYADKKEITNVLAKVGAEQGLPIGYYDIHRICKRLGTGGVPKFDLVLAELEKRGFKTVRPHYSDTAVKTDAGIEEVEKAVKTATKKIVRK